MRSSRVRSLKTGWAPLLYKRYPTRREVINMRFVLAALPFLALIIGMFFANRTEPYVLGMPFIMFWTVLWVVLTSVIMFIVFKTDPANKEGNAE
jgi:hypothetical protein